MKHLALIVILFLSGLTLFCQQGDELSQSAKKKIIEEVSCCSDDLRFLLNSKECISLINLSFQSERNMENALWCKNIIACLEAINNNHDCVLNFCINWEKREIDPIKENYSKICGVFNYSIVTNLGCIYSGRNLIKCDLVKKDNEWNVANIEELTMLNLDYY